MTAFVLTLAATLAVSLTLNAPQAARIHRRNRQLDEQGERAIEHTLAHGTEMERTRRELADADRAVCDLTEINQGLYDELQRYTGRAS